MLLFSSSKVDYMCDLSCIILSCYFSNILLWGNFIGSGSTGVLLFHYTVWNSTHFCSYSCYPDALPFLQLFWCCAVQEPNEHSVCFYEENVYWVLKDGTSLSGDYFFFLNSECMSGNQSWMELKSQNAWNGTLCLTCVVWKGEPVTEVGSHHIP